MMDDGERWVGDREDETGREPHCTFERAGRVLGVRVEATRGIVRMQSVTPIPLAPAHLAGLINADGEVLPLLLLDGWLGRPGSDYPPDAPVLIIESDAVRVGVLVDRILGVEPLPTVEGTAERSDAGICVVPAHASHSVTVLDAARLVHAAVSSADAAFLRSPFGTEGG